MYTTQVCHFNINMKVITKLIKNTIPPPLLLDIVFLDNILTTL